MTPRTDSQSGYREYDGDDIVRLELIHTVRLLDVPIADIRQILAADTAIHETLERVLERTTS